MPAKPAWLLHIPGIVAQLEVFNVPVLDRAIVESLFGLRRRQAIELLHRFGGYEAGNTLLVNRLQMIEKLRAIADGEEFQAETERKGRLADAFEQLHRHRAARQLRIPVAPDVELRRLDDLPKGITLDAGHLHVEFVGAEDLLAKLYEFSKAAANDFDRLRAAAEPVGTTHWDHQKSN